MRHFYPLRIYELQEGAVISRRRVWGKSLRYECVLTDLHAGRPACILVLAAVEHGELLVF